MATTSKLGLKKPVESDYFNINDFNDNMDKIDALTHIKAVGTTTANRYSLNSTTSVNGNVAWRWKKYDDGTFEAYTCSEYTTLRCNDSEGQDGTWRSGYITTDLPAIGITSVTYSSVTCKAAMGGDSAFQWAVDTTPSNYSLTRIDFVLVGMTQEPSTISTLKKIYFQIKGTWK